MLWKHRAKLAVSHFLASRGGDPVRKPSASAALICQHTPVPQRGPQLFHKAQDPALMVHKENGRKFQAIRENVMYKNEPTYKTPPGRSPIESLAVWIIKSEWG